MDGLPLRPLIRNFNRNDINRQNVNANRRHDNGYEMTLAYSPWDLTSMKVYKNLYSQICSIENLQLAFKKARERKTLKDYVIEFESDLKQNLIKLSNELEKFTYSPSPLSTFIVRDPKTRKISASYFRDRVVHHAICNILSPIFEKDFIFDSFANRKGKGTHNAINRFEQFLRKTTLNHQKFEERERALKMQ